MFNLINVSINFEPDWATIIGIIVTNFEPDWATIIGIIATLTIIGLFLYKLKYMQRKLLKAKVEAAYKNVQMVCEPETLNPAKPGNPHAMKKIARDYINPLIKEFRKVGFNPPSDCDISDDSLKMWFKFLAQLRKDYY